MSAFETTQYSPASPGQNDDVENNTKQMLTPGRKDRDSGKTVLTVVAVLGWILCIVFLVLYRLSQSQSDESNDGAASTTTITPAKNLILIVSDGMGQSYNSAYRLYKGVNETVLDKYFKGRFSTTPSNDDGVTDSAAAATVFACGVPSTNGFIGLDSSGNPHGSILAAAKRQGKGTGVIATKTVTDATPGAFTAYALTREWKTLISKQQATRQMNGAPIVDIMLGGGRKFFEAWNFFDNTTLQQEYGWSKVSSSGVDFLADIDSPDVTDLPYMGLFANDGFPYYIDRLNGFLRPGDTDQYPDLLQMTKKSIDLLDAKFSEEGFFLMVESSSIDLCGHINDVVCLMWEVEEFMNTVEYAIEWAEEQGDTLVVIVSDHETGGLSVGRSGSFETAELVNYFQGLSVRDDNIAQGWGSFLYNYEVSAPVELDGVINRPLYKWYPQSIATATHSAFYFAELLAGNQSIADLDALYDLIEDTYLGAGASSAVLTENEQELISSIYERDLQTQTYGIAQIMNARTLTGWTTKGHTGADIPLHAFGPNADMFSGHWTNWKVGQLLTQAFGVEAEQQAETEDVQQAFVDGTIKICDESDKPKSSKLYVEWNDSVAYPEGNLLYGANCVDAWI